MLWVKKEEREVVAAKFKKGARKVQVISIMANKCLKRAVM